MKKLYILALSLLLGVLLTLVVFNRDFTWGKGYMTNYGWPYMDDHLYKSHGTGFPLITTVEIPCNCSFAEGQPIENNADIHKNSITTALNVIFYTILNYTIISLLWPLFHKRQARR